MSDTQTPVVVYNKESEATAYALNAGYNIAHVDGFYIAYRPEESKDDTKHWVLMKQGRGFIWVRRSA